MLYWGSRLRWLDKGMMPEDLLPKNRAHKKIYSRSFGSEGFSSKNRTGKRAFEGRVQAWTTEGLVRKVSWDEAALV